MTIKYDGKTVCCCCANCTHDCGKEEIPHEMYECEQYRFSQARFNKELQEART